MRKEKTKKEAKTPLGLAIFVASVISLIFGLPHLFIPLLLGGFENYKPFAVNQVPLLTFEETWSYAAQTRQVYDGHFLVSDYHLAEYKDFPPSFQFLSPFLVGTFSRLAGSVEVVFIASDFLLPPIIFLIIYLFLFKLTSEPLISTVGGILILTASRLFQFIPPLTLGMTKALWNIFMIDGSETTLLEFSRLFHPQLVFLFLILHLYFLFLALKKKSYFWALFSSIFLSFLFYSYFYYWTFALADEAVLFLIFFFQKDRDRVKTLVLILTVALLSSIPYWLLFFKFRQLSSSADVLTRMGLEMGRVRNIIRTIQYLTFVFIFFKLVKKKDLSFWFLLSFLLGGIVCLNLQLLTGYTIQSWHWTLRVINPLSIIMLLYLLPQLLNQKCARLRLRQVQFFLKNRLYKPLLVSLIIVFLLRAFLLQTVVSKNTYQGYTFPKTTLEAFEWLNQNTPNDSVVLTPSFETTSLIPVYTHNSVFLPHGAATYAPDDEIIKRLLATYKIFDLKKQDLSKILNFRGPGPCKVVKDSQSGECLVDSKLLEQQAVTVLFYMKYLKKSESFSSWSVVFEIPEEIKQQILAAYEEFLKEPNLLPIDFQLDYIYHGPAERRIKEIDFSQFPWAKEVYQNENVRIYQVTKKYNVIKQFYGKT